MNTLHIVKYCCALLLAWTVSSSQAGLVINEILTSNSTGLEDGYGEREDWIEIFNNGSGGVDLAGYYLTDEPDFLTKWPFPSVVLPAGGYLVVIASGKDLTDPLDYLHTNFRLGRSGNYLALVQPSGTTIEDEFTPSYPEQFSDISYGIQISDGALRFFAMPTPGAANGSGYLGVVKDTNFSMDRGFYDSPIDVEITSATPGSTIHYTTDGTKPSETVGMLYTAPVTIASSTPLRAVAYKTGWFATDVDTQTYIFVDHVAQQPTDPPGWPSNWGYDSAVDGIVPSDYEMDPRVVDNTQTNYSIHDALLDLPSVSIAMLPNDFIDSDTGIYANPRERWERECSVEYIHPDGVKGFQYNCKIEVHGNSSRNPYRMQKHSLRLTFTTEYGPAELHYPLFDDSPVTQFNQLVLRACFTDSWGLASWDSSRYRPNDSMYIRDVWMKDSLRDMAQPSSHGNFAHLYVNGLYFGIHNLTERLAPEFFADYLGGQPEDWEVNTDFSTPGLRWNAMMAVNPSSLSEYVQIQNYLDTENFSDYMLLHFYGDAEDWPHHNGYAAVNPVSGDGRYRFFVWDQEIALDYHGRAASRIDSTSGAGAVFQKMRTSAEFRLLFADRVYKHCFHDGALSMASSQERYRTVADEIDKAIVAESARWGDTQATTPYGNTVEQPYPLADINHNSYPPAPHEPDIYFTREDSWVIERDNVISNYIPAIHNTDNSYALINVLRAENLYPDIDPPEFNQNGGEVSASFGLLMTAGAGAIIYTLDGTDPRQPGGDTNPLAHQYAGVPISFTHNPTMVKARLHNGTEWSALHEAPFFVDTEVARAGNLVVSEIHYNPIGSDSYEFIELQNVGSTRIALDGVQLSAGVEYTFGNVLLEPGEYTVVIEDVTAFSNRYLNAASPYHYSPIPVAGVWSGSLANGGENIRLLDRDGNVIQNFTYDDGGAWPGRADGRGSSLQRVKSDVPLGYPEHWAASGLFHGSPGRDDDCPEIVINELMSHSDTGVDWIELLNAETNAVDVSGWFLSDQLNDPFKYAIPARAPLAPGEFAVFDQNEFGIGANPFSFSELGEEVVLTEAVGTNILRVIGYKDFGAAAQDVPFGRYLRWDGTPTFTALRANTAAASNAYPLVGPVVIGEIMYHPVDGKPEYVELINITPDSVTLYDPNHPTNSWKLTSAITYNFPEGVSIPAYGRILLTGADSLSLRAAYDIPPAVAVFGPWDGQLGNAGESVRLRRPGSPEPDGTVPYIVMDRVDYRDYSPWPLAADGAGASLERLDYHAFGNDWRNWYASATSRGTPGSGPDPAANEPNQHPMLTQPEPIFTDEGVALEIQFEATDPDNGQQLYFRLRGGAPEGASISSTGLFTWIPGEGDGPGNINLDVKVTDDGIPNLSASITVPITVREVNTPPDLLRGSHALSTNTVLLIPFGSTWRYLDDGSDQGTLWANPQFDDSSWVSGPAKLGYSDSAVTTVSYGPDSVNKYRTTYFRHTFTSGITNSGNALWIDFGQATTPVQDGYQAYTANHEQLASFLAQTFDAFGTLVTLNAQWAPGAVDSAAQMYDRGTSNSDTPDLMRDWIGTDRRVVGNPLTLTLSGLPPGSYSWKSYHHDTYDQTGQFDVIITDAQGARTTLNIDISTGNIPLPLATTFSTTILSDGSDITLTFDKHSSGSVIESFFLMNAFQLSRQVYDTSATLSHLALELIRDDGAIVYLNGIEVARDNMPAGVVNSLTLATGVVGGSDETTPHHHALDHAALIVGTNTLAVEIHQHSATSSDLGLDLALNAGYVKGGPNGLVDYVVNADEEVNFVCQTTDADRPTQGITYTLGTQPPEAASVDLYTGQFRWTPRNWDGPAVVTLSIIATDNGIPPMSDEETFTVTVIAPFKSGDVQLENGYISWPAIPGDLYRIEASSNLVDAAWQLLEERTATQPTEFVPDPDFSTHRTRFYRVLWYRD